MSHCKAKIPQIRFLVSVRLSIRWSLTLKNTAINANEDKELKPAEICKKKTT